MLKTSTKHLTSVSTKGASEDGLDCGLYEYWAHTLNVIQSPRIERLLPSQGQLKVIDLSVWARKSLWKRLELCVFP